MPNINARIRLERLSAEISQIREHVVLHSGVSARESFLIDNLCSDIIQDAARIAQEARKASGNESYRGLVKTIRKALGFTQP